MLHCALADEKVSAEGVSWVACVQKVKSYRLAPKSRVLRRGRKVKLINIHSDLSSLRLGSPTLASTPSCNTSQRWQGMSVKSKFYDIIFTCRFCAHVLVVVGEAVEKFPIPSLLKDNPRSETFVAGKFSGRTHKSFLKMFVCVYESIGGAAVRLSSRETQTQTSICSPSTDKRRRRVAIYFYIHHFCCCA